LTWNPILFSFVFHLHRSLILCYANIQVYTSFTASKTTKPGGDFLREGSIYKNVHAPFLNEGDFNLKGCLDRTESGAAEVKVLEHPLLRSQTFKIHRVL
jgi:hypothetical protein